MYGYILTYNLGTKITEVIFPAFTYRLFHEDFSLIVGTNLATTKVQCITAIHSDQ